MCTNFIDLVVSDFALTLFFVTKLRSDPAKKKVNVGYGIFLLL